LGGRGRRHRVEERQEAIELIEEANSNGARIAKACEMLGISSRTFERWREGGCKDDGRKGPRGAPANKLSQEEREEVLRIVNNHDSRDLSPNQIVPRLADQGMYVASESTMYRILREEGQQKHRETSLPATHKRPVELLATGPDQVWSWDISYLQAAVKGKFYYLYLVLDVWSRKIVGWEIHDCECMEISSAMIARIIDANGVDAEQLSLHSDNGGPMKGSTMLATLEQLGIMASFSRPGVSDDNPYSESLFRTLKYRPEYPRKPFESIDAARRWVMEFVKWYNTQHLHSGIRFVTPEARHNGNDKEILRQRHLVYEKAKQENPTRWTGKTRNWDTVENVSLNPAKASTEKAA
jgi:putative transposase